MLYVALFCWLMTAWMADDSWAFRATPLDWWREAGVRFAQFSVVGVVAGFGLVGVNKLLSRIGLTFPRLSPWKIGFGALAIIVVVSGAGAARFILEKPYM